MSCRIPALASVLLAGLGCAHSVTLAPGDRAAIGSVDQVPVLFARSASPWVDCPNDSGRMLYDFPGADRSDPRQAPWSHAVLAGPSVPVGARSIVPAVLLWDEIMNDWTQSLQTPPEDPARATGRRFRAEVRAAAGEAPLDAEPEEVPSADPRALAARFGQRPVLVFQTTRWVLAGCFYAFRPWFNVSATLIDLAGGRVLWQDKCGGSYPPANLGLAEPDQLNANGRALYLQVIEARAAECSAELLARFRR